MRLNFNHIILAMGLLLLVSCGNRKGSEGRLPKVEDAELLATLDSLSNQEFQFFYSKLSTNYQDSARNVSFKTSIRMVRDSAMGATISYANIPVISAVVSVDSVKMTDKQKQCYTLQSIDFIKESFGVNFSHRNMEELIMGFPIAYDKNAKYERIEDPFAYILSTELKKDGDKGDALKVFYQFNKALNELKSTRIESSADNTIVKIDYLTRQLIDGYSVPLTVKIVITTPKQEIVIDLEYNKPRVNEREQIHFVIPESYEPCTK